jgi:periplasmic protein TonB
MIGARVPSLWLGSGVVVVGLHGTALAALALAGVRVAVPPVPEPVVMIELPPLAAPAPQMQQAMDEVQPQVRPDPVQPQSFAPRVPAPPVSAPLPRDPVAAQPPQPQPQPQENRGPTPPQPSAAQPQGTGSPDAPGNDPRAAQQEADYRSLVRGYIGRNRFSPPQSRRAGLSGDIGVRFIVNRAGDISSVTIARSSGHELLDSEAVEFVRRLRSVPAFPRDLRRAEIPLNITLRFSLESR